MEQRKYSSVFKIIIKAFIVSATLLFGFTALAQKTPGKEFARTYWLSIGLGPNTFGSSAIVNINVEIPHDWLMTAEFEDDANSHGSYSDDGAKYFNYNIMAGKIYKKKFGFAIWSAGLGFINESTIQPEGVYPQETLVFKDRYTLGIPFKVQAYLVKFKALALGLGIYGNFNLFQTKAGVSISLAFGRLTRFLCTKHIFSNNTLYKNALNKYTKSS